MGFVSGFTGGVTLTLSAAYLSILAHQRTREHQSAPLRASAIDVHELIDPRKEQPLPPTRSELAAAERAHSVEAVKDRWNQEVENAARWVQHTDWDDVRATAEASVAKLWSNIFSEAGAEAEKAQAKLEPLEKKAKAKIEQAEQNIASAAKGAFEKAKQTTREAESAAILAASKAKHKADAEAAKVEAAVEEESTQAKGWFASALDKGKQMAGAATTPVGVADVEIATDGLKPLTPVQKALRERYQRPEAKHNKTVEQALKERYTPIDKRDNTVLRGI
ncbi:hypothetical protein NLU13_7521 [Sarocladium strictum]|uniref:MICOS complex subunit MIC12 n=1 Tax=Sarocladium strictum TaxID=5046 RepID=A0AA39GCY5_SARSR|nr:hypothetical protein NLU13_7521 [Sarocladium strictum]